MRRGGETRYNFLKRNACDPSHAAYARHGKIYVPPPPAKSMAPRIRRPPPEHPPLRRELLWLMHEHPDLAKAMAEYVLEYA